MKSLFISIAAAGLGLAATARGGEPALRAAATTGIIADVAARVAGDRAAVHALLPPGADPHAYDPRPADLVRLHGADVIFHNGFNLEPFLATLERDPDLKPRLVAVSAAVEPRRVCAHDHDHGDAGDHDHGEADPHVWMDPHNVMAWTDAVAAALAAKDPAGAAVYRRNAAAYRAELEELDRGIREQFARIPAEHRVYADDHDAFGYFAARYGFRHAGSIVRGLSTAAQPSARDLAQLERTVRENRIPVLFVGRSVNPALAERVARDTGAKVVPLYTGALGQPGSGADTYLGMMNANAKAIVEAIP